MNGLMPSCWGAPFWHSAIHAVAYAYKPTPENKINYYNYFYGLQYILPCEECKSHYKQNIYGLKNALDSQESLFRWTYDLHNLVNIQTGVPESKWPDYESIKKKYSGYEAECNSMPGVCGSVKNSNNQKGTMVIEKRESRNENIKYIIIIMIITLILIISLFFNFKKKY
jgi:hypothetical protein